MQNGFVRAVLGSGRVLQENELRNQNVLIVGGDRLRLMQDDGTRCCDMDYLASLCLVRGAKTVVKALLYSAADGIEGEIRGTTEEIVRYYVEKKVVFERVIMLDGLTKTPDPFVIIDGLRKILSTGGKLDLFLYTPQTNYVKHDINFYEDIWRFTEDDIIRMFSRDVLHMNIEDVEGDYFFVEIIMQDNREMTNEAFPIFSCRAQGRIMPMDLPQLGFFRHYRELDRLGALENTDKNCFNHNYLPMYEFILHKWKEQEFNLLELGIYHGGSARMWEEYFPKAKIHCVDIDPKCRIIVSDRIIPYIMDLGKQENLEELRKIKPEVIVDDASHLWKHQILALFTLFPVLPSGGVYILEDMETSLNRQIYTGDWSAGSSVDAYSVCERIARVTAGKEPDKNSDELSENITAIGLATEMVCTLKGCCIFIKR